MTLSQVQRNWGIGALAALGLGLMVSAPLLAGIGKTAVITASSGARFVTAAPAREGVQCRGIAKSTGRRCKLWVYDGTQFCGWHKGQRQ